MMGLVGHVAYIGENGNARGVLVGNKEIDHMKELGSGRIILKWVLIRWDNVDWTYLIQDKDSWWAVVNLVMKLWVQ
jgi:hypothetical protein